MREVPFFHFEWHLAYMITERDRGQFVPIISKKIVQMVKWEHRRVVHMSANSEVCGSHEPNKRRAGLNCLFLFVSHRHAHSTVFFPFFMFVVVVFFSQSFPSLFLSHLDIVWLKKVHHKEGKREKETEFAQENERNEPNEALLIVIESEKRAEEEGAKKGEGKISQNVNTVKSSSSRVTPLINGGANTSSPTLARLAAPFTLLVKPQCVHYADADYGYSWLCSMG